MSVTAMPKKRRNTFNFTKEVDVEIDIDDLEEAGYHHEDDCPAKKPADPVRGALAELHRQAHPDEATDIARCNQDPCRWLSLEQIRGAA